MGICLVWLFPRLVVLLPQQKATHYIGRVGLYGWIDLPLDIQEKMSAGLTSINTQGEPVPTLAQRWSVEESGRVFRFLLREGLQWQDGKEFVSDDVQYNFADVQIVRTENEVVFRLNDAYAPFPVVVAQPLFRQVQEKQLGFIKRTKIIGLGEYQVTKLKYTGPYVQELIIENNQERLVYRFFSSESEAVTAFRRGRIDTIEQLPSTELLLEDEKQLFQIEESINPRQYVAVYFNTAQPNLTKEMRRALNFATQKPGPNDEKLRALSPIAPTSWAYNATNEIEPFTFNLENALESYEEVNPQQATSLNLKTAVSLLEEGQKIGEDWKKLGEEAVQRCQQGTFGQPDKKDEANANAECERWRINVEVQVGRDLTEFDAVLIGREVPADPDQYIWWHSNQGQNLSQYQNPRVDKLLEDARKETDQQKRKVLYLEFQRYLVEDVPAMFLYYVSDYTVQRRNWL